MRVFTDGETHLVLGAGGLAVFRSGEEPSLIAIGPATKRGAVAVPPRDVLAPLNDDLDRALVTVDRTAYEVSLSGGAARRLPNRILDAVRGHDGRLFAVTAEGTGEEPEAELIIATLEPGEGLVATDTLKLPPPVRIEWPKATIWEAGVDPWPEADEDFDAKEHKLGAIAVGYSSRDGTTFYDAVHLATSAHGVALASTYSGVIAVVRPGAREVAFTLRVPATRDAQELFAVPTREGVLVVTTMHGKNSAVLHLAPNGKVLAHVSRFADGLAFGLGAPFLVDDTRAVLVQSLKGGKVTALTLPGLAADVLGDQRPSSTDMHQTVDLQDGAVAHATEQPCLVAQAGHDALIRARGVVEDLDRDVFLKAPLADEGRAVHGAKRPATDRFMDVVSTRARHPCVHYRVLECP